ncbi:rhodanese-like domain-containing protein [Eisenibacter elegans]|jgi:rhodanese-related sulfurtransferase|uniref:rhodanese-like domain-containing protein n=1 Tax=Eisenibacter elegans TaxID=997 RepID=UPI0004113DEA|nr:rhodanese-like domain-containing protein [Eisenibacter elegans]
MEVSRRSNFLRLGLLLFLPLWLAHCSTAQNSEQRLSVEAFATKLEALPQTQLIDIRTPAEFAAGHLPGAVNIDYFASDFAAQVAKLDPGRPVMIYCATGNRSGRALGQFQAFAQVYEMRQGFNMWAAQGLPVVKK